RSGDAKTESSAPPDTGGRTATTSSSPTASAVSVGWPFSQTREWARTSAKWSPNCATARARTSPTVLASTSTDEEPAASRAAANSRRTATCLSLDLGPPVGDDLVACALRLERVDAAAGRVVGAGVVDRHHDVLAGED